MIEQKLLIFKKIDDTIIDDVNQYVKDWIKQYPYGEVTIGCDSQTFPRYVRYSIAIVMHMFYESKQSNPDRMGHGAHVISALVIDRNKNLKTDTYGKLWAEATYTLQAAQMIDDCTKNIVIHLDYNSKEGEFSNVLYQSGIGLAKSYGYEAYGKPFSYAASHCADHLCR